MKKIMASILLCSTLLLSHAFAIDLYVDGEKLAPETAPVMINNRTLVPLRCIFEALQAEVNWDNATKTATASKGDLTVSITINATTARINKDQVDLDTPAIIQNGSTMVPVRFVSEALNADVRWDGQTQTVYVSTKITDDGDRPAPPATTNPPTDPTPKPNPTPEPPPQPQRDTIYITKTGTRYHHDSTCNGGTYYESTLSDAKAKGLTPCSKCVNG